MKRAFLLTAMVAIGTASVAADRVNPALDRSSAGDRSVEATYRYPVYKGWVSVIDGRTLWYPQVAQRVRLAEIDACEVPQWALDPKWTDRKQQKAPYPVPCGPLAKAWLKRTIANGPVECRVLAYGRDGIAEALCLAKSRDVAAEMLRVGWARVATPYTANQQYLAYQRYAAAARYGMWATYVLDMNEWRRKAIDKTLDRRPIADENLLADREREISPPFVDYRNRPIRTDR